MGEESEVAKQYGERERESKRQDEMPGNQDRRNELVTYKH